MSQDKRIDKVQAFFNQPQYYLHRDFGIKVRSHIAAKLLQNEKKNNLLDLGCGDGSISLQFLCEGANLTLIDLSEPMLNLAKQKTPSNLINRVTYLNIDFIDYRPVKLFDVVLCFGVLAHVSSVEHTIAKISSFLNPGGIGLLQFTDAAQMISKIQHFIIKLRNRKTNNYDYSLNRLKYFDLILLFQQYKFKLLGIQRYLLIIPGMGILPDQFLYQLQMISLQIPWIGKFGTDAILKIKLTDRK